MAVDVTALVADGTLLKGAPSLAEIGNAAAPMVAEAYVREAVQAGDPARLLVIARAGHFEIASPRASTWPQVESAIRALMDGRLPRDDMSDTAGLVISRSVR